MKADKKWREMLRIQALQSSRKSKNSWLKGQIFSLHRFFYFEWRTCNELEKKFQATATPFFHQSKNRQFGELCEELFISWFNKKFRLRNLRVAIVVFTFGLQFLRWRVYILLAHNRFLKVCLLKMSPLKWTECPNY